MKEKDDLIKNLYEQVDTLKQLCGINRELLEISNTAGGDVISKSVIETIKELEQLAGACEDEHLAERLRFLSVRLQPAAFRVRGMPSGVVLVDIDEVQA